MVKHYIIMSSSYTDGTRIALDITEESLLNGAEIKKIIQEIQSLCDKDVPLSTHLIETESAQWDSVKAYDPFFEDVVCTDSVKIFAEKIKKGRTLTGLDVATYILTQVKCTHLSLEKLAYFAYADYLCSSGKSCLKTISMRSLMVRLLKASIRCIRKAAMTIFLHLIQRRVSERV